MDRLHLICALVFVAPGVQAATYTYTGANYTSITNFTTCLLGTCANYTSAMSITGSFTLAAPLAANLSTQDIAAQVTGFSFSDGLATYTSADPNSRILAFAVSTDATGTVTRSGTVIVLELWTTGSSPHSIGNRLNLIQVANGTFALFNSRCVSVISGDLCNTLSTPQSDSGVSQASSDPNTGTFGLQAAGAIGAPALSEWAMILLAMLMGLVGWRTLRSGLA